MARILDRSRKSGSAGGGRVAALAFDSSGVSAETSDVADFLAEHSSAVEIGTPELHQYAETTDGTTAEVLTVPSGAAWRLVGLVHQQTNSSDAATRTVTVSMRTAADADIEVLSSPTSVADAETEYSFLFGSYSRVGGTAGVAAQGTLTIAEPVTDGDDFTINGVTFTLLDALTGAENEILIGANEAATKTALNAAFGASRTGATGLHSVTDATYTAIGVTAADFSGDDMVFTANNKGTYGNSIEFVEATLTHASNVLDGSGTLGGTTAGVDQANAISALDFPEDSGPLLTAGEDVEILVTNGQTADDFKGYLFVIAYSQDPTT